MARRRKQQKPEDTLIDIVEARQSAQDFFETNQNLLIGIIGGIVLIVGGYFAYQYLYLAPKQDEAVEQMYQAQMQFERDSFALALNNPGGGFSGFLDIIDGYGGTKAANISKYYAGICYLNLGAYEDAISMLKKFKAKGDVTPIMKHGALGDAYSELNDMDKALSNYKKATTVEKNDYLTPYYLKKLALLHQVQGDNAKALKIFQEIEKDYPNSVESIDVSKYIGMLESK